MVVNLIINQSKCLFCRVWGLKLYSIQAMHNAFCRYPKVLEKFLRIPIYQIAIITQYFIKQLPLIFVILHPVRVQSGSHTTTCQCHRVTNLNQNLTRIEHILSGSSFDLCTMPLASCRFKTRLRYATTVVISRITRNFSGRNTICS